MIIYSRLFNIVQARQRHVFEYILFESAYWACLDKEEKFSDKFRN